MHGTGFEHLRTWLADVRKNADPHVSCILVGNKVDLCEESTTSGVPAPPTSSSPPNTLSASTINKASKSSVSPSKLKWKSREVSYEEAELWAKQEGLLFVEASAKSGLNVEQAFVDASRDILEKIKKGVFDDDRVCYPYFLPLFFSFWYIIDTIRRFQSPGVKQSLPNSALVDGSAVKSTCCA